MTVEIILAYEIKQRILIDRDSTIYTNMLTDTLIHER